jgi:hypothetical protein
VLVAPQLRNLACDVYDLAADAGNLGLPLPLGIELRRRTCGGKIAAEVAVKMVVDPGGAVLMGRKVGWLRVALVDDWKRPRAMLQRSMSRRRCPNRPGAPLKGLGTWPAMTATPRTSLHNTPQPTVDITASRASKGSSRHELVVGHPKH